MKKSDIDSNSEALSSIIQDLVHTVAQLRDPLGGCPWDKEQTHSSLAKYAIEEAYELADAIAANPASANYEKNLKDELGDLLFQSLLHAQLASERSSFDFADVAKNLNAKLHRRHPHVFGDQKLADTAAVIENWAKIKDQEKLAELDGSSENGSGSGKSTAQSVDQLRFAKDWKFPELPALIKAHKIGERSNKYKFDWSTSDQVMEKVNEELNELTEAMAEKDLTHMEEEFGDLLFSLAQWGRHSGIDAEQALRKANQKFLDRFKKMLHLVTSEGKIWDQLSDPEKETYWTRIKS